MSNLALALALPVVRERGTPYDAVCWMLPADDPPEDWLPDVLAMEKYDAATRDDPMLAIVVSATERPVMLFSRVDTAQLF
jgi:hypothetical protein